MMTTEALPTCTESSPARPLAGTELLLIQVPRVRVHTESGAMAWRGPAAFRPPYQTSRRPRRRLKPKVRRAGRIVVAVGLGAALLSCCAAVCSERGPARALFALPFGPRAVAGETAQASLAVPTRPAVVLWVEAVGTTGEVDDARPVVLPGYLLPDDGHEEPAHEGS